MIVEARLAILMTGKQKKGPVIPVLGKTAQCSEIDTSHKSRAAVRV